METTDAIKACRKCKGEIPRTARKCRHCGSDALGAIEIAFRGVLSVALGLALLVIAALIWAALQMHA